MDIRSFKLPFLPRQDSIDLSKCIGAGWESSVYKLEGTGWVVKKPLEVKDSRSVPDRGRSLISNPERFRCLLKDEGRMEEIFGVDRFLRHHPVRLRSQVGEVQTYPLQPAVNGKTLKQIKDEEKMSKIQVLKKYREEFLKILWGAKKAFLDLKSPVDLNLGNLMVETDTEKLIFIDSGSPSYDRYCMLQMGSNSQHIYRGSIKRIFRVLAIERLLRVSQRERQILNQKYGTKEFDFEKAVFMFLFEMRAIAMMIKR